MAKKKKNIDYDNLKKFKENLDKDIPKHKTLTQTEYDALTETEKNNGTIYFIEDGNSAVTDSDKDYIDSQDQQILNSAKAFIRLKAEEKPERKCFYYGKNIKRTAEGICKQSAFHKHNRHHEQHERAFQRRASNSNGGGA